MKGFIRLIAVVCILLYLIGYILSEDNFMEYFSLEYGHNCEKCKGLKLGKCINCSNCGFCMNKGKSDCVPGDLYGPYINRKCGMWYYHDPFSRELFYRKNKRIKPYE